MAPSPDLGSVQVDARKVKQIVYNLLSNAVKFTHEGGEVTLHATRVPRVAVRSPLPESDYAEFLEVSVTDNGIGISPDGIARLFQPFSQIDSGLARKFEGTGLGLAMVKRLADLHGGAVAVESAVGTGSCFRVWLPLRAGDGVPALATPPAIAPAQPQTRFGARVALVVEDDFKSAELIRLQLEAEGFEVVHALSAEAALAIVERQPLALITLDIMLPDLDGWEFLGRLKQASVQTRPPIVIISIVADRNKGFALGAAAVLQKPIARQELHDALVDLTLLPLPPGREIRVLAVDDDPKALDLLALWITALDGVVVRAGGGREAIEIAGRERLDLIVLDLMMPDVTGFDVAEALQRSPDTARIPILVVTAKDVTTSDRARLNGYVMAIVEKSDLRPERFGAEVHRAMAGRRLEV